MVRWETNEKESGTHTNITKKKKTKQKDKKTKQNEMRLANIDDADAFVMFQEFQSHGNILKLLRTEGGLLGVLGQFLSGQDFNERDQFESVRQVRLQTADEFVDGFQMLVGPSCKCVLLDALPLGILRQISFRCHHDLIVFSAALLLIACSFLLLKLLLLLMMMMLLL